MKQLRFPFRLKMGLAISLVAVGMTGISVLFVFSTARAEIVRLMASRLKDMGRTGAFMFGEQERLDIKLLRGFIERDQLPAADLNRTIAAAPPGENIDATLDPAVAERYHRTPEFQRLVQILRRIKNGSRQDVTYPGVLPLVVNADDPPLLQFVYLFVPAPALKHPDSQRYEVYKFLADADYDHPEEPNAIGNYYIFDRQGPQGAFYEAFQGRVAAGNDFYEEKFGTLFSAAIPIKDRDGKVLAILGLDYGADTEANKVRGLLYSSLGILFASLVISVLVSLFLSNGLNKPIKALRAGAERVRARDFNTHIEVSSRDEFGLLANTFNGMVDEIRDYAHGLEELSNAYYRFVPREFLNYLERESIVDVKLGDQVQREMTVLFSDIRSFTTLSEGMTPKDNFNFLNGYLGNVSPIIRQYNGFVDKYIGDAVMALFPGRVDDAIDSAVAMHRQLREYNLSLKGEGMKAIKIGVGLHSGNLMLGTVGEEKRMESTVISDAVNLASRLEGLTKKFGSAIIVSEKIKLDARKPFRFRYLGKVRVKGKLLSVKVYEVLDAEPDELQELKMKTLQQFEAGVDLFQHGEYARARAVFAEIEEINPVDRAVRAYIDHCDRFIKKAS